MFTFAFLRLVYGVWGVWFYLFYVYRFKLETMMMQFYFWKKNVYKRKKEGVLFPKTTPSFWKKYAFFFSDAPIINPLALEEYVFC